MTERVTVVVVPRDRFSSVVECTESILANTPEPFRLAFLDFGYSQRTLKRLREVCAKVPFEIVSCGRTVPMSAFRDYVARITTKYTCWVDNDTFVTPRWMTRMLQSAEQEGMRVILPLTFEREGLDVDDRNLTMRVHVSHSELRKVTVDGKEYVFDYKPFRRAAREDVPEGPWTIDFFELHTFFAETAVLQQLDFPPMVVREHIDLGIQLHKLGIPIWCEPRAEVVFDNIHLRPTFEDLQFFFYRWSDQLVESSHRAFEQRWKWNFYNEQYVENWAFRRRIFSVARFCFIPNKAADLISRAAVKYLRPPIPRAFRPDPMAESTRALGDAPMGAVAP